MRWGGSKHVYCSQQLHTYQPELHEELLEMGKLKWGVEHVCIFLSIYKYILSIEINSTTEKYMSVTVTVVEVALLQHQYFYTIRCWSLAVLCFCSARLSKLSIPS